MWIQYIMFLVLGQLPGHYLRPFQILVGMGWNFWLFVPSLKCPIPTKLLMNCTKSNAKDNKISLGHVFAKYISFLRKDIDVWVKFFIIYPHNDMSHTN